MPRNDGEGPRRQGPMTGRAAGYCAGLSDPGYKDSTMGRGGRGRCGVGRGGGFGRGQAAGYGTIAGGPYGVMPTPQQELDDLKGQSEYLEDSLNGIKTRITELEAEAKK